CFCFFFQAEDGIRDKLVTGVQTCALPIYTATQFNRISAAFRQPGSVFKPFVYAAALETAYNMDGSSRQLLTASQSSFTAETSSRSEERRVGKECRSRVSTKQ